MMKGICLRYSGSETEAEDLLQEAFVKAFKSLDSYSGKGALGGWLRMITINTTLEHYRKQNALKSLSLTFELKEDWVTVEDGVIEQLELEDLLQKIQSLPSGFRTVFNLYAVEGYTHKEIGKKLGISSGTSKSQYSRARLLLRKMIQEEASFEKKELNYAK